MWRIVPVDTNQCVICRHFKSHAPCILNLATGEIEELALYGPNASKVGEIADEQIGGTFSLIRPLGLQGIRMTAPWYIEIKIPITGERKVVSLYCLACRDLLREYERGYVLLDLYS